MLKDADNKYSFKVDKNATKGQIKEAVETLFKVNVLNVNTSIMPGKKRRLGVHQGYRSDWKKAIIKLKKGQEIELVDDV